MKEKIEQLCDQIKGLLKINDREYIVANVPMSTEEASDYCLPEYYKTIIGDLSEDSCDKLYDNTDDFTLGDEEIYEDDYQYADERLGVRFYVLLAIRIENGNLVFCIEESEGEDYDADFKTVAVYEGLDYSKKYSITSCLEAYVRILSDETKSNICWKI